MKIEIDDGKLVETVIKRPWKKLFSIGWVAFE